MQRAWQDVGIEGFLQAYYFRAKRKLKVNSLRKAKKIANVMIQI
jgi:hypothetical protein